MPCKSDYSQYSLLHYYAIIVIIIISRRTLSRARVKDVRQHKSRVSNEEKTFT
jgi:hypothetical protein